MLLLLLTCNFNEEKSPFFLISCTCLHFRQGKSFWKGRFSLVFVNMVVGQWWGLKFSCGKLWNSQYNKNNNVNTRAETISRPPWGCDSCILIMFFQIGWPFVAVQIWKGLNIVLSIILIVNLPSIKATVINKSKYCIWGLFVLPWQAKVSEIPGGEKKRCFVRIRRKTMSCIAYLCFDIDSVSWRWF